MTVEALRHYLEATPFAAFRLITASGKKHFVAGPEFMQISPSGKTCNVYSKDGESFATLDVGLITEILPEKRAAKRKKIDTVEPAAMEEGIT